jgi:hypothetical protein
MYQPKRIYKLLDWIDIKIHWDCLSSNSNAIHLLEANPNDIHLLDMGISIEELDDCI